MTQQMSNSNMEQLKHPMMHPFPVFPQVPQVPRQCVYPIDRLYTLEQRTFALEQELFREMHFKQRAEERVAILERQIIEQGTLLERIEQLEDSVNTGNEDNVEDRLGDLEESNRLLVFRVEDMNDDFDSRLNKVSRKSKKYRRRHSRKLETINEALQSHKDLPVKVNKITTGQYDLECYDNLEAKVAGLEHSVMMLQIELGIVKCKMMTLEKEELEETMENMVSSIVESNDELGELDESDDENGEPVLPIAPGLYETLFPSL